jgi:hypothetical protein
MRSVGPDRRHGSARELLVNSTQNRNAEQNQQYQVEWTHSPMASRRSLQKRSNVAKKAPWLALVAATSLGGMQAETVRMQIKAPPEAVSAGRRYRLVVQSYDESLPTSRTPGATRPRGSTQRTVTADDLVRGVRIDLLELTARDSPSIGNVSTVLAWLEPGNGDLELDARRARPRPGSFYGVSTSRERGLELCLDQRLRSG